MNNSDSRIKNFFSNEMNYDSDSAIDLISDFRIDSIRQKAYEKQYSIEGVLDSTDANCHDEVINGLKKVLTISNSNIHVMKSFNQITNKYVFAYQTKSFIKELLKSTKLYDKITPLGNMKVITCCDVLGASIYSFKMNSI